MSFHCGYCGYGYIEIKCKICNAGTSVCGCDFARDACEEHFCIECDEPKAELDEDGVCVDCLKNIAQPGER